MVEHNNETPSIEINKKLDEATRRRNSRVSSWDEIRASITDPTPEGLAPIDQLHSGGLAFTRLLARLVEIKEGEKALDVACGVGGPARILAAEHGASVTGVDITDRLVDLAARLSELSGISVTFEKGDALSLPYEDGTFDVVWTQHAAAAIADKKKFYSEIRRVLKPGGRFAMHDFVTGPSPGPLHMPIPTTDSEDETFILSSEDLRTLLSGLGLDEVHWRDVTEATKGWFRVLPPPGPFSMRMIMGETFVEMVENLKANFEEGRIGTSVAVFRAS